VSNSLLRQFAVLWMVFCGALAYRFHAHEQWIVALVFAGLGLAFGPMGLVKPLLIRPLFVVLMKLTFPIGWVVSHVLLAFTYYVVLTPFSVLFRLLGRDALGRRKRPAQSSYWTARPAAVDVQSYFRQS